MTCSYQKFAMSLDHRENLKRRRLTKNSAKKLNRQRIAQASFKKIFCYVSLDKILYYFF